MLIDDKIKVLKQRVYLRQRGFGRHVVFTRQFQVKESKEINYKTHLAHELIKTDVFI